MISELKFEPFNKNQEILDSINTLCSLDHNVQETVLGMKPKDTLYELKSVDKFDTKLRPDDSCDIWSICLLNSGDILITDEGNKILKLVDGNTYVVKDSLKVSQRPRGVCKGRNHEAIVCLGNNIQFVSAKEKLLLTKELSMNHICLGVCLVSSYIFVTDGQNRNIFKYDFRGNLLKTISGDKSFSWNLFLASSFDSKFLYVTDCDNGLLKIDLEGYVIWKQQANIFKSAYGVCTDGHETVFVSGLYSNNVIQISSDGTCLGEVIKADKCVTSPSGVCFDRHKSKLIVVGKYTGMLQVLSVK